MLDEERGWVRFNGRVIHLRKEGVSAAGDEIDWEDLDNNTAASGCSSVSGFSVHAGVGVPAHDRMRLERLCRYVRLVAAR